MRTALLPEPSGGETVFSRPPTDADAEASTAVTDRYVPARGSLCGAQPPVAVVLGVETSGVLSRETDLRGGTSPQGSFILAPLVCRA